MKLEAIFEKVAQQMQLDFEQTRNALEHPGLKGSGIENIFREFLRKYLPKSLDISSGILIDSNGEQSRQLDVIISDAARTPIFYEKGEVRVIPIECAYAVIEVKSNLDSEELKQAFTNMKSVRALKKAAYFDPRSINMPPLTFYGREYDIWPVHYFIFAADSIGLGHLMDSIHERHRLENLPLWSRIDTVCVLNKGIIANMMTVNTEEIITALPDPATELFSYSTKWALLLFYTLISHVLFQARIPDFRFHDYIKQIDFRSA